MSPPWGLSPLPSAGWLPLPSAFTSPQPEGLRGEKPPASHRETASCLGPSAPPSPWPTGVSWVQGPAHQEKAQTGPEDAWPTTASQHLHAVDPLRPGYEHISPGGAGDRPGGEGEEGRAVWGQQRHPCPFPLADAAPVQLGRPRVCQEGCTHWEMRSPGLHSAGWIPARAALCSAGSARAGQVGSSCSRKQPLPWREGYMERGSGGKKCQLTAVVSPRPLL